MELYVNKISHDGAVTIKFNQELVVPDLDLLSSQSYGSNEAKRSLGEIDLKNIIDLKVDASNYSVSVADWTANYIKLQINFD